MGGKSGAALEACEEAVAGRGEGGGEGVSRCLYNRGVECWD